MNGRALAEALKRDHPNLRVIFMSGYTSDVIDADGIQADQLAYLQKPFKSSDLMKQVRETLDAPRG